MTTNQLNVGIIGAGRIGKVHAENLAFRVPEARAMAITDLNREAAERVASRCGIPTVAGSVDQILANRAIQAVLICSSTDTHAELIIRAAQAGKHIFCEKPIAHSLGRIDAALAAAGRRASSSRSALTAASIPTSPASALRWPTARSALRACCTSSAATPRRRRLSYVKVSGGIFLDMTIHDFDMARFLIGDEVEEIYTAAGVMVDPAIGEAGDLDTALLVLRFRNGVIGTIDNCRQAAYGYDQRAEILGSAGSIATENCYPNQATISTGQNVRRDLPLNFFMERYTESFATEVRSFVQSVVEDKPTAVSGMDGRIPVVMGAGRAEVLRRAPRGEA